MSSENGVSYCLYPHDCQYVTAVVDFRLALGTWQFLPPPRSSDVAVLSTWSSLNETRDSQGHMPSPIGHALGSLIVSGGGARPGRSAVVRAVLLVAIGVAPDLDLLWGRHSGETHSLGAAFLAGLTAFVLARTLEVRTNSQCSYEHSWFVRTLGVRTNFGVFLLVASVWFTHPLMDAIGEDSSAPFGVMLWWPFSHAHVIAPFTMFDSVYRAYWKFDFWTHNARAGAKEILILGPILAIVWFWRRRMRQVNRVVTR